MLPTQLLWVTYSIWRISESIRTRVKKWIRGWVLPVSGVRSKTEYLSCTREITEETAGGCGTTIRWHSRQSRWVEVTMIFMDHRIPWWIGEGRPTIPWSASLLNEMLLLRKLHRSKDQGMVLPAHREEAILSWEMFTWAAKEASYAVYRNSHRPTSKHTETAMHRHSKPWTGRKWTKRRCWLSRIHSFWMSKGISAKSREPITSKNFITNSMSPTSCSQHCKRNWIKNNTRTKSSSGGTWLCRRLKTAKPKWNATSRKWITTLFNDRSHNI